MMSPSFWHESWTVTLVNHLWQSTVFALISWFLALTLRNNPAQTRYWVWMVASVKFLIPFSIFTAAGEWIRSATAAPIQRPALAALIEQVTQPFSQTQSFAVAGPAAVSNHAFLVAPILIALWACGSLAIAFSWMRRWWQIRAAVHATSPQAVSAGVPVLSSSSLLEPGVFGILRPVLMLPEGILDRLTAAQLDAIVAHEMCHIRRRDNLTFAIHMVVETLFWFHPLVWWIRARLVEERELACDEAVLQSGSDAEVYAEGILNVCKFYVESPLACVSGVSGSDLKKRIVRIMTEHGSRKLDVSRKLLLGATALVAVGMPMMFGLVRTSELLAQSHSEDVTSSLPKFDAISIKPAAPGDDRTLIQLSPDATSFHGAPIRMVLQRAFGVEDDRIIGAPSWVNTNRYDIEAKVSPEDAPKLDKLKGQDRDAMLIPLLTERFNLRYHHETRELKMYALMVAKGGPKLIKGEPLPPGGPKPADGEPVDPAKEHFKIMATPGHIEADSVPMYVLADPLTQYLGRRVVDKTGLTGNYNFTLRWTPENAPPPMLGGAGAPSGLEHAENATDSANLSLFTAIQEQLGLKLESEKGLVDVIVIDHIDPPSAN